MSEELNCTNCSIGDFKHDLCDCDNGFCKEFKSIGSQEDFFNAVMQRIRPQGEWIDKGRNLWGCSNCGMEIYSESEQDRNEFHKWCSRCGARMKGADDERHDI